MFDAALDFAAEPTKPFVVQYEVKLTKGLTCGGAYVKLLSPVASLDQAALLAFDGSTRYSIMFGPDACGNTNKVHVIFQYQNPVTGEWSEHHATATPQALKDTGTHLYTLVVRPNQSFEVFIDMKSEMKGTLTEALTPPINPPKDIDDPADFKPEDWVDEKRIKDPDATKPDDWDEDEPRKILDAAAAMPSDWLPEEPKELPDPAAEMPDDWDEDEDGEWEAPVVANPKCGKASGCGPWERPMIDNPAFKGKWSAPMIDNPAYKGEWAAKQIPNPGFFEEPKPFAKLAPIAAAAIEVWTMSGGIRFDNVVVGRDEGAAMAFAAKTWRLKADAEGEVKKVKTAEERQADRERKREEGGLNNMIEVYLADAMDFAQDNAAAVLVTLLVATLGLVLLCSGSGPTADAEKAIGQTADEVAASELAAAAAAGPAAAADAAAADEAEDEVAAEDAAAEKVASEGTGSATKRNKAPKSDE